MSTTDTIGAVPPVDRGSTEHRTETTRLNATGPALRLPTGYHEASRR